MAGFGSRGGLRHLVPVRQRHQHEQEAVMGGFGSRGGLHLLVPQDERLTVAQEHRRRCTQAASSSFPVCAPSLVRRCTSAY